MRNNLRPLLLLSSMLFCVQLLFAQYSPFSTSPYSGVAGLATQPATIADNRYSLDIMPAAFHLGIASDFAGNLFSFNPNDYTYSLNDRNNLTSYMQLDLLNAMYSITSRQSVGLGYRSRAFGAIGNAAGGLLEALYQRDNLAAAIPIRMDGFYAQYNTFSEVFASYAMMITPVNAVHAFSVGATLKLNTGGSAIYMKYTEGTANYDPATNNFNFDTNTRGQMGQSESKPNYLDFGMGNNLGFGADIGVSYEYRPNIEEYKYDMDGKYELLLPYPRKYLVKASVAIHDLGTAIKYSTVNNYTFTGNGSPININGITPGNMNERVAAGVTPVDSLSAYSVKLPMVLNATVDWHAWQGVYVNLHALVGFSQGAGSAFYRNTYTLTPRYERLWFGAGLPIQLDQYSNVNVGVMLRLGPLWVGSQTLITSLASKNSKAADLSVMVKIPFGKVVKRDSDKDAVSDEYDLCPDHRGPWETLGCPDTDGDGVPDEIDECPYEAGAFSANGCPDTDGDNIPDAADDCPDEAGPMESNGCPDADGDGIIDRLDDCPDEAGPVASRGCPDTDGDGVVDKYDRCPDVRGLTWNFGCPEGYEATAVTPAKELVPLTATQKEIVDNAFKDVHFETGKTSFSQSSYPSLDKLAELLRANPTWSIVITGHTDNAGTSSFNKLLSQNRAVAGLTYLVEKGIPAERIEVVGMGDTEPVASNDTEAGRKQNQRMVVTIVK